MDRSKQTGFLAVVFSALVLLAVDIKSASAISCSFTTTDGFCALRDVAILTNSEANAFVWPDRSLFSLLSPTILPAGARVFSRISSWADRLYINDGFISELYIRGTLYELIVIRSQVRNLKIDEDGYYLRHVEITYNQLRSIPDNFTKLPNLEKLYLHDNEIEFVNMTIFRNSNRLEVLDLQRNRIVRIDTNIMLNLPKLTTLSLRSNFLENLLIKRWNFPNLKKIDLDNNRFRMIQSLSDQFPYLNEASLGYNRWSCIWLEQSLPRILNSGRIRVNKGNETCSGKSVQEICCYDSAEDMINSLEKSTKDQIDQISVKLERAMQQTESIITNLDDGLKKKSREIDDLKAAIERNLQTTKADVKLVESKFSTKVSENRAMIDDGRKQLEKKIGEIKSDMDRNVQKIKEETKTAESVIRKQIESDFREINVRINASWVQMDGKISKLDNSLDHTNGKLNILNASVKENRALIGNDRKQTEKKIGELKSDMDRDVRTIKEEIKTAESVARKQVESEFQEVNERMNASWYKIDAKVSTLNNTLDHTNEELKILNVSVKENQALIEDDRKQMEKKIGETKMDIDRHVLEIKEHIKTTQSDAKKQVETKIREVNERIDAVLEDDRKKFEIIDDDQKQLEQIVVDLQSDMEHSVQANKAEIDSMKSSARKHVYEHALLEEKVDVLKRGIDKPKRPNEECN